MNRLILIIALMLPALGSHSQYLGGNADGTCACQSSSTPLNNQSLYCGGSGYDGYSSSPSTPAPLNNQALYCSGGNGDGYNTGTASCSFSNYILFCSGGSGDGFASGNTGSFNLNNQVFYCSGGDGDGYNGSSSDLSPLNNQIAYCSGGNGDGFHAAVTGTFSFSDPLLFCSGGSGDGYHVESSGPFLLGNQNVYCSGGIGDGYHFSSSAPVSLGNGIWRGITSTDWSTASNWVNSTVPDETTDAVIPPGCPYYPVLTAGNLSVNTGTETYKCKGLLIKSGARLTNTGNLSALGILLIYGEYTADNNTDHSQVIGAGGTLSLFPGGQVNLGNQSSTAGLCDLMIHNGGAVSISGGSLFIDDQLNILSGGALAMTDGILFAHRFGLGSEYSSSSPGAFFVASGASGNITGGLVKVNGKSSDGIYSAVGIYSPAFDFSGTSVLKITDGLNADYSISEIRTIAGADLNNLTIDKPFRTVRLASDANILNEVRVQPASGLQIVTGANVTVGGDVILY